jgi:hypothetical protein
MPQIINRALPVNNILGLTTTFTNDDDRDKGHTNSKMKALFMGKCSKCHEQILLLYFHENDNDIETEAESQLGNNVSEAILKCQCKEKRIIIGRWHN